MTNFDPQNEDLALAAAAALELERREREERWKTDPFSWFVDCATLIDPLASGEKVAPFPNFPYLKEMIGEIDSNNAVILWKSRRMIASWTAIAYAVRMCMLFKHIRCYFISRVEGDTDGEGSRELVWRARFVAEHIRNAQVPRINASKLHIEFLDTGSTITGVSCAPNVMRQVSANLVVADEFAFWDHPRDSYAALKPTLEARGKFIGISSAAEGFFKEVVQDLTEAAEGGEMRGGIISVPGKGVVINDSQRPDYEEGTESASHKLLNINANKVPGFAAWTNPINKFRIVAIHYTADPRKRTKEWKDREQEGMPYSLWLREYEMSFSLLSGMPVYMHEWQPSAMLVNGIKTERNRPIIVGLDFGYHNPAMVVAQFKHGLQLCVLRCFQGRQLRFEDFMHQALANLRSWFPSRHIDNPDDMLWCCDCSGDQEHSTGQPEVHILRRQFGIRPKFKKMLIPPTIDVVRGYMSRSYRGEPCFLVDNNPTNQLLIDGLNGGYAYPEGEVNELTRPEKDNTHDHLQDCLRYIAVNFGGHKAIVNHDALSRMASADILHMPTYVR